MLSRIALRGVSQSRKNLSTGLKSSSKTNSRLYATLNVSGGASLDVKKKSFSTEGTPEYRVLFFDKSNKRISPWHDIPLIAGTASDGSTILNFINEIPRLTRAKMEISTKEELNPITQDTKNGKLRFINYSAVLFNYGALPQTWEDPAEVHPDTGKPGDGDPVDVIDLSTARLERGEVTQVKVVGALALIDEGETDWKVLVINVHDKDASNIHTPEDIEKYKPGALDAIRDFYANYKTADGKPANFFGFNGAVKDAAYALNVIHEAHASWKKLIANPSAYPKYSVKRGN